MNERMLENLLREVQRLHERNELSGKVGPDYFEPGMMEYLDKSDGSYDRETGTVMLRFDSRGTRYEGRTEAIENIPAGISVRIARDKENPFNSNNFTMFAANGSNIGHMPAELCNVIAPLYDEGYLSFEHAEVSYVEPLSKRNRHAKQATLFVSLTAHLNPDGNQDSKSNNTADSEEEFVIPALHKIFPDGVIYREQNSPRFLGVPVHHSIYTCAKETGLTVPLWLEQHGFQWREIGFIEGDMLEHGDRQIISTDTFTLSDSILRKYPLIGQYEPSDREFDALFSAATDCVLRASRAGSVLSKKDEIVLTVATVQLLKKRGSQEEDDTQDDTLWSYIYQQYGFNPENSATTKQRVYKAFCDAIKETLELYHRFFAPSHTMRYYTSLLLHAIAPKESIDSLFDDLFDFYVHNLDFQYVADDISYKMLVKGMQARWTNADSEVQLKNRAVTSALKTLLLERPGYMAVLFDELTEKIDRLLRGETVQIDDRWDRLLVEWYQRKSSIERSQIQGEKRKHNTEFIATTAERIFVQYRMEKEKVGLFVPQIRLSSTGESRPLLTIWQGTECVYRCSLSTIGDDLCLTTKKKFIPLDETDIDFNSDLELKVDIQYQEETVYSSLAKLHRKVICFDTNGNEKLVKSGTVYLFASENQNFEFADDSGVISENHVGQLFRVNLGIVGSVTANGVEIFADEERANKLRLYPSIRPAQGIELCSEGRNYQIFAGGFSIKVHIPETENPLRYQLTIDGDRMITQPGEDDRVLSARVPDTPKTVHVVRLVDLVQSVAAIEYAFVILPDFTWKTDKPLYLETESDVKLTVSIQGRELTYAAFRVPESNVGSAQSSLEQFSYEFDIPTVNCRLGDSSAFLMPKQTWHEDIRKGDFIHLMLPDGWQGQLMIGSRAVPQNADNSFEIGNYLYSGEHFQSQEPLWLLLKNEGAEEKKLLLTDIFFEPAFYEAPIELTDDEVVWRPESKFFGAIDSRFKVKISGIEDTISASLEEKHLFSIDELKNGKYHCRVYLQGKGVFSRGQEKLIHESDFIIGGENFSHFDGFELVLKEAIYWASEMEGLRRKEAERGAGVLCDLEYLEESVPSGEAIPLPRYRATMYIEMYDGRRIRLNSDENNTKFELINPVSVWIVNDRNMILQDPYEGGLTFDIGAGRVITKKADYEMPPEMRLKRLKTPDYFGYEMRKS